MSSIPIFPSQLLISNSMDTEFDSNYHIFRDVIPQTRIDYIWHFRTQIRDSHTFNHIGSQTFKQFPLSVSIGTKPSGGENEAANAQIAIWQAAQWAFLQSIAPTKVNELPFLPGLVAVGDKWKFVATTWENGNTVCCVSSYFSFAYKSLTFQ